MKTLYVYRLGESNPCWYAPFWSENSLMAAIRDYSERGFYCRIV